MPRGPGLVGNNRLAKEITACRICLTFLHPSSLLLKHFHARYAVGYLAGRGLYFNRWNRLTSNCIRDIHQIKNQDSVGKHIWAPGFGVSSQFVSEKSMSGGIWDLELSSMQPLTVTTFWEFNWHGLGRLWAVPRRVRGGFPDLARWDMCEDINQMSNHTHYPYVNLSR